MRVAVMAGAACQSERRYRPAARLSNLVSTSTEENHPLDFAATPATILDYIAAFGIGVAFLNLHRLFANDAVQEIDQGAFVVVQWTSP